MMRVSIVSGKTLLGRAWRRLKHDLSKPRKSLDVVLGDHADCSHDEACAPFAFSLHERLSTGPFEWPVSILLLHDQAAHLAEHRTARKRAAHCRRLGYVAGPVDLSQHIDELYAINTSLPERQGRPMSARYVEQPTHTKLPAYLCPRHRVEEWGVTDPDDTLVAYLILYLSGELVMVSSILGHGDHLRNDVMYLLMLDAFEHIPVPATIYYYRHDSGTAGLRYFKERLGFQPTRVKWRL